MPQTEPPNCKPSWPLLPLKNVPCNYPKSRNIKAMALYLHDVSNRGGLSVNKRGVPAAGGRTHVCGTSCLKLICSPIATEPVTGVGFGDLAEWREASEDKRQARGQGCRAEPPPGPSSGYFETGPLPVSRVPGLSPSVGSCRFSLTERWDSIGAVVPSAWFSLCTVAFCTDRGLCV